MVVNGHVGPLRINTLFSVTRPTHQLAFGRQINCCLGGCVCGRVCTCPQSQHCCALPHCMSGYALAILSLLQVSTRAPSLGYPDPQKIRRRVWVIGFGGNVHSRILLTRNCLPANASLVDFSITYKLDVRGKADTLKHNSALSSF